MSSHTYSVKQLLVSFAWLCIAFTGIAFSLKPLSLPLDPAYDALATVLPILKVAALAAGIVITCLALIPLVTHRRPVPILIFMLVGMGFGLFIGSILVNKADPRVRLRGTTAPERRLANVIYVGATIAGALMPLALIYAADRDRRTSIRQSESTVTSESSAGAKLFNASESPQSTPSEPSSDSSVTEAQASSRHATPPHD